MPLRICALKLTISEVHSAILLLELPYQYFTPEEGVFKYGYLYEHHAFLYRV